MRKQVGIGFEADLRDLLDGAAEKNGRSLAEEVRQRLWMTFGDGGHEGHDCRAFVREQIKTTREWQSEEYRAAK